MQQLYSFALVVSPTNRGVVNEYMSGPELAKVHAFLASVKQAYASLGHSDHIFNEHFLMYIQDKEKALFNALDSVSFDIKSINTLYVITGDGRFEQVCRPVIQHYILTIPVD